MMTLRLREYSYIFAALLLSSTGCDLSIGPMFGGGGSGGGHGTRRDSSSYLVAMNVDGSSQTALTPRTKRSPDGSFLQLVKTPRWLHNSRDVAFYLWQIGIFRINTGDPSQIDTLVGECYEHIVVSSGDEYMLLFQGYIRGIMDLTSGNMTSLSDLGMVESAAFSSDGSRFVFGSTYGYPRGTFTVVDSRSPQFPNQVQTGLDGAFVKDPQFSPDDEKIVFCTYYYPETTACDIYSINEDGTGLRNLTDFARRYGKTLRGGRFILSPTGTKVLFSGIFEESDGTHSTVRWILGLDSVCTHADVPSYVRDVWYQYGGLTTALMSFSPDGSLLVGISREGKIVVLGESGELIRTIDPPDGELFSEDVQFSPDGTKLISVCKWGWEETF